MPGGPILIFDKSTIQALTVDESVLLDNFYMSNVVPVFFAECLADLERNMKESKGTAESLVGALATRTPDMQVCGNVFHMRILQSELVGSFDLAQVQHRPLRERGEPVMTGDMRGMLFHASEEEEAVQRWAKRDFLDLERQQAKQWRSMIEKIDLNAMSENLLGYIGPWRKPKSLEDAKFLTDTIIDCIDQEWLLRYGLVTLGLHEATDQVANRWAADRRKPLRSYLPYFVHILSINIFFALVLRTTLLRRVKPSHQIDLSYLYYLPFCMVFTSRDNFHVQVARLFMTPSQAFVHGDELKEDLRRLHERYQQLPQEELDKGLVGFAPSPPPDDSFLTTQLWDKHLPSWRLPYEAFSELPKEMIEELGKLGQEAAHATPAELGGGDDIGKFEFVTVKKRVSMQKGSYLRFARDAILQITEQERRKVLEEGKTERSRIYPAGTLFAEVSAQLGRLSIDPKCRNLEVVILSGKLDQGGKKVLHDGMWSAEISAIGIHVFDEETNGFLKQQYDKVPVLGMLVLWTRYGVGKLGIALFRTAREEGPKPAAGADEFNGWEGKAIADYLRRHNL